MAVKRIVWQKSEYQLVRRAGASEQHTSKYLCLLKSNSVICAGSAGHAVCTPFAPLSDDFSTDVPRCSAL